MSDKERACAEAWHTGGREAERSERDRWNTEERERQLRSVRYLWQIREDAAARARERGDAVDDDASDGDDAGSDSEAARVGSTVDAEESDTEDSDAVAVEKRGSSPTVASGNAASDGFIDQEASAPHTSNLDMPASGESNVSDAAPPPLEDMSSALAAAQPAQDLTFITGPRAPNAIWDDEEASDLELEDDEENEGQSASTAALPLLTATTSRSLVAEVPRAEASVEEEEEEEEEIPEEIQTRGARWLSVGNSRERPAASNSAPAATAAGGGRPLIEVLSSTDVEALD